MYMLSLPLVKLASPGYIYNYWKQSLITPSAYIAESLHGVSFRWADVIM